MSIDTRTAAEIAYDAQRDGSIYIKPEPRSAQFAAGYRDGLAIGAALIADDDDALSTVEEQIINILLQRRQGGKPEDTDGGERRAIDLAFDRVIDRVAELPDHQRRAAVALWEGLLIGLAIEGE